MKYNIDSKKSSKIDAITNMQSALDSLDSSAQYVESKAESTIKSNILESNSIESTALESIVESNNTQANIPESNSVPSNKKAKASSHKKVFTFYINADVISALDEFIAEFGEAGDSRNTIIENAIMHYIESQKSHILTKLEAKIKKLKKEKL